MTHNHATQRETKRLRIKPLQRNGVVGRRIMTRESKRTRHTFETCITRRKREGVVVRRARRTRESYETRSEPGRKRKKESIDVFRVEKGTFTP
jgi:hypothetical protein